MKNADFQDAIRNLAFEAGLRRIKLQNRKNELWIGVLRGIFIVLDLDAVRLHAHFNSPESAKDPSETQPETDGDQAVETKPVTQTFERAAKLGIPADWFDQFNSGTWGFELIIDAARRNELPRAQLTGLLDAIAQDLHDLGAEDSKPCVECAAPATTLAYFQSMGEEPSYAPYCQSCFDNLQSSTRGQVTKAPPTHQLPAWGALSAVALVMAAVWGYAQHPDFGVPIFYLIVGCAAAGGAVAAITTSVANGSNLRLRLGVVAAVLLATLIGNIIGIKLLLESKGFKISWLAAAPAYLLDYLPRHLGQELLYFVGGVLGVLIAFYIMRESERIRIR